jgi:cytochrome d ubiquinol oxidase subunit II
MGVAILAYVILDGYDLGVGMLMANADKKEKDKMIASIGPFWDANETWLVLSVGLLLVAFPKAHGIILTALYLPVAIMLLGLILRGVAFDFRAKVKDEAKATWDKVFISGSLITSIAQGFMLGMYIVGFEYNLFTVLFSVMTGVCLAAGYSFVGASWLIMKTETFLQIKAVKWAKYNLWFTALGMVLVSIASPLVNMRIFDKWFSFPNFFFLAPIPIFAALSIIYLEFTLRKLPKENDKDCWVPFAGSILLFILGFIGLAYSFFPYIVPDQLTIWDAASSPESLKVILIGTLIVLPFIILYTIYAYRVFWGKVRDLNYY